MDVFERLDKELIDLRERFFGGPGWVTTEEDMIPRTNVAETDGVYEVTLDLPGVKPEEVKVELKEQQLWVTGEHREETDETEKTFHRVERRQGSFRRIIPLPTAVDPERVEASFEHGVLKVELPKIEEVKPKSIEIKLK
jgi:HSP20 family protein